MTNIKTSRTIREFRYHDVSGKGTAPRPATVDAQTAGDRWCVAVGKHQFRNGICRNCHRTRKELH